LPFFVDRFALKVKIFQGIFLLLDEALSAFDSQSETYIQKVIADIIHDKTVIVVVHRL